MTKTTITTILIFFCAFCYGQETKTYNKDNITFEYSNHWIPRDFPEYYILVSEPPKEQMSIMTTFDVALGLGYESLEQYTKIYEEKMKTNEQFMDFKIMGKNQMDFKEMNAIEYHCTATVSYFPIEWKSIVFMKNRKVYRLSTTSLIGQFYLQKEMTEKIFESFSIE